MTQSEIGGDNEAFLAARGEIEAWTEPCYIKDSELRYLAVNEAYASLWGCDGASLIGTRDEEWQELASRLGDRDEKERRSLVFGQEQVALFQDSAGQRYRVRIRREKNAVGQTFIVGHMKPAAHFNHRDADAAQATGNEAPSRQVSASNAYRDLDLIKAIEAFDEPIAVVAGDGRMLFSNALYREGARGDAPAATPAARREREAAPQRPALSNIELLAMALDEVDAGIVIYDANDVLQFANQRMKQMFEGLMPPLTRGTSLRAVLESLYDNAALNDLCVGANERERWIGERIRLHHRPLHETVEQLSDGRWIKAITRRIANDVMIGVRMDITNVKQGEHDLRLKNDEVTLYKAVLDQLPNSTYVKDEQFRLTFANRAYGTLTGWNPVEILGKTDVDLFGAEGEALVDADRKVLESGKIAEQEETLTRLSGEKLALVSRKARVVTEDGRTFLIGSTLDITAHKQRETELFHARREAETVRADLESVVEGLEMSVVVVDANDHIEMINGAYFRIWQQPADPNLVGRPMRSLMDVKRHAGIYAVSDGEWEAYVDSRLAEIRAGNVAPREMDLADGRTLIYSVRSLSEGKRMICHFDISEQKAHEKAIEKAQAELERTSALMRQATSAMAQGLCIYDNRILLTNDAFHEMIGIGPDEIGVGTLFSTMIEKIAASGAYGDEEATRKAIERIVSDAKARRTHLVERRGAGDRWLRVDAKPDDSGVMITTYTDVTETKTREEDLKELLVQAELADRAKSEFLANMSHEIRTPMNGVLGMAELLARTQLDTRQKTFTDVIVKSGNALLTIINDILDFSKIDAGRMVLDSAPFDLAEAIEDVATLVSTRIAEKDIEFIVRTAPDLPARVIGDAGRVRQVITNLVGNASKFTEMGHVLVDASATVMNDVAAITIRIEDTGIGIPADKLASIFDKFSQVDGSSTRRHEGTGLGLSIASGLIGMMGGTIAVESTYGQGSVFTVRLDLPVDRSAPKPRPVPVDVTGARVLVIDDNPVNRDILMEQLRAWSFDACAVASGPEGMEVLLAAHQMGVMVDVVVLDYHMPGMNGADVALAMRAEPTLSNVPLVMLTSVDIRSEERRFPQMKVDAHLMKPARSSLLLETIVEVLQSRHWQAPPPGEADAAPGAVPEARLHVEPATIASRPRQAVAEPVAASGNRLDVLVAEDNEVNQIVFSQILDELDVAYLIVRNGQEALDSCIAKQPRMILMDVSMPIMNGHEATRAIREHEAAAGGHVPIVGVTAHALKGDRDRCIEAGMDDYMSKPISPEKLGEKVRHWLSPARAARLA